MSEVNYGFYSIETLESLYIQHPEHTGVLIALTQYYKKRYDMGKALKYGEIALRYIPNDPELNKILAGVYYIKREYQEATNYHQKAIGKIEYTEYELMEAAWAFQEMNIFSEAVKCYDQVLQDSPKNLQALINAGYCYGHLEKNQKAIEYSQRALQVSPNQSTALLNLGFRYWVSQQLEEAKHYTEKCIYVSPSYHLAFMNLGHIFLCEGDEEKALKNYQKSVKLFSEWKEFKGYFWDDWKYIDTYGIEKAVYEKHEKFCKQIWDEKVGEDNETF